jgi:predicted nucleotidyltransferase component of viral defense system
VDRDVALMKDIGKSTIDRLKYKAKASGKSFQLILQLFSQEEFLRRVNSSKYRNNMILKGGLLLYCLSGFSGRPTMDIDFLIRNISNETSDIEKVIKDIINQSSDNSFVSFQIREIAPIAEHREYNGIRVKLTSIIQNTKTPFDVDMGVGDVIIPKPEMRAIPTQLEGFAQPEIMTYSLESVIAEKFDAILERMELGSRMKDYYDIFYLANTFSFEGRKLQEAIFETLQKRGTSYEPESLDRIYRFKDDDNVKKMWKLFIKNTLKQDAEFETVLKTISNLLMPVYTAIIEEEEFFMVWDPEKLGYYNLL